MNSIEKRVVEALDELNATYDLMECDPDFADTAAFCERYGVAPEDSANAIVVASRKPAGVMALCLILATSRLDVNRRVRDAMGVKKLSFASPEVTADVTGMMIGGVTPFGLDLPTLVDTGVTSRSQVVIGGGSRSLKVRLDPEVFERAPGIEVLDLAQTPE